MELFPKNVDERVTLTKINTSRKAGWDFEKKLLAIISAMPEVIRANASEVCAPSDGGLS